jgi:L-alanine-DL-glutamate epimerase-like enolase superfamily enzyme
MRVRIRWVDTELNRPATLRFHTLHIPFRQRFSHASASRDATSSIWVEALDDEGLMGVGEACPRPYVTGETLDSARGFFAAVRDEVLADIHDGATLRAWVNGHAEDIDRHPAAWCAIELALIDLFARQAGQTAEVWLGLPATGGAFQYSAVLGDADPQVFSATFARYREAGLTDFKLKLSGDLARDRAKLAVLAAAGPAVARLRLDANNLWRDADHAIAWLAELAAPAFAIEEALPPDQRAQLPRLARALNLSIILDESLIRLDQLDLLARLDAHTPGTRWIANLRVSKLGGLLRTLDLIDAARAQGLALIVGAQVGETSLLTRVALAAARAAGDSLIAQEGAFGTQLLENDVCTEPLMFGRGGLLRYESGDPGWGVACTPSADWLRD